MTTPDLISRALDEAARVAGGDGQPRPLAELRSAAAERLAVLGAPTKKLEAWKYTDVRKLLARDYAFAGHAPAARPARADLEALRVPGLGAEYLVFVNGAFEPELSSAAVEGVAAGSLRAALAAGRAAHFGTLADAHDAAFVALNQAFELDGPFVHVPAGRILERPLHVVHVTTVETETFVQSRGLIVIEAGAQARVVESHHSLGAGRPATFANVVTEVFVGDDAVLEHHRIQDEGNTASQVNGAHVAQGARSVYRTGTWTFSGELVRNDLTVALRGENSETNLAGLYVVRGDRHVDNRTLLDHAAPGCTSDELYRGIVFDESVGVFNGKVLVRREGQQTNAYQQSQGVVLSDTAKHFSKPELEIYADDVKCSHGSTTGEVDPEAMFYLRSRGISQDRALALLLTAFAHDVVERVGIEPLRVHLDRLIDAALS